MRYLFIIYRNKIKRHSSNKSLEETKQVRLNKSIEKIKQQTNSYISNNRRHQRNNGNDSLNLTDTPIRYNDYNDFGLIKLDSRF